MSADAKALVEKIRAMDTASKLIFALALRKREAAPRMDDSTRLRIGARTAQMAAAEMEADALAAEREGR